MVSNASGPDSGLAREASGFFRFVTDRPVAVLMLINAAVVFGVVSFGKLRLDLLPEISYPTLTVRTAYRGAAPEDVEDRISERVQEALSTLPDLVRSTSISRAETSDVVLEFDWGTPMTFAVQDVRDKLDGVFLPQGAEKPLILRYDPNLDPILRLGLTSAVARAGDPRDERLIQLRWLADKRIQRELEAIPGVAAVQVRGGLVEEIRVRVDPFKMAAHGIDPAALATRLAQENINASGGLIREGSTEYLVRTLNEFGDLEEIEELAIARVGAATVRVRDVATVARTHAEREVVSRLGGTESVEIAIYREAGANIVALADQVRARVFGTPAQQRRAAELEKSGQRGTSVAEREGVDFVAWRYRDELAVEVLSDQSTFIRAAIDDVKSSAIFGSALAVLVILLFLRRLSPTLIIGVSIPISVVVTFAPMYIGGVSLNIMSLGGLALGVGMLVDNAIVVLESITRCREDGDSVRVAAIRGTREVAGAITSSTLTTVAVFAPIVFIHGVAGQLFGDQALTIVTSLLVSLVVAVLFIPMLASRPWLAGSALGAPSDEERGAGSATRWHTLRGGLSVARRSFAAIETGTRWDWWHIIPSLIVVVFRFALAIGTVVALLVGGALAALVRVLALIAWPVSTAFDRSWRLVERAYPRVLAAALRAPWTVLLAVLAGVGASGLALRGLGVELLPEIQQGEFTAHVALPVGTPLEVTEEVLGAIDTKVRAMDGVAVTALTAGVEKDTLTREIEGKHTARLTVRLDPLARAAGRESALVEDVRTLIAENASVLSVEITRPTPFAMEAPVTIEVLGHDLAAIQEVGARAYERLSTMPELADVRSSVRTGHPELRVTFDRDKTLEYGIDLTAVSNLVRDQVLGNVSTRFTDGEERIDVRVIGDEILLSDVERVLHLVVNPGAAQPVELRSIARVDPVEGPAEIRRIGNTRAVVITAEGRDVDLGGLTEKIQRRLADLEVPDDVAVEIGGQKRELDLARASLIGALLLAVFLVYVVMASQFESLLQPLLILLTVPLAIVGVVLALAALGLPFSVLVFIGVILLAGIVVNNAIVLVDRVNQNRERGLALVEAVVEAGSTRLRPIMMTTGTTVIGLLPMTGWLDFLPFAALVGGGEGAEVRAPMAITVIAGLSMSTLLTLIVIPVAYTLAERAFGRGERRSA